MATRGQIIVTVGTSGSGKTYRRCAHYIINDFFREYTGRLYCNFPLGVIPDDHRPTPPVFPGETYVDRIAVEVERRGYCTRDEAADRIVMISDEVLESWRSGASGPWEYFEHIELDSCRIMIDEIHNYAGRDKKDAILKKWSIFNGEVRKRGAQCEYLSQHPVKVAKEISREGDIQLYMSNMESARDPLFRIPYGEWWELMAKFVTGRYKSVIVETEKTDIEGRWVVRERRPVTIDPFYFDFYDSYNKPAAGGKKGTARRREHEKRSMIGLLWWFVSRNAGRLAPRVAIVLVCWWFFIGGGIGQFARAVADTTSGALKMPQSANDPPPVAKPAQPGASSRSSAPDAAERLLALDDGAAEPRPAPVTAADPHALRRQLDTAKIEAAARTAELANLRAIADAANQRAAIAEGQLAHAAAVVAITRTAVTMRIGYQYTIGERIDFGVYNGRTVRSIDWTRRTAELDDGTIIRMASPGSPSGVHGGGLSSVPAGVSDAIRSTVGVGGP